MHEIGIAQSIVDVVLHAVPEDHAARVASVRVRVGALSGVSADALAACFDAVASASGLPSAQLEIDRVDAGFSCLGCGATFGSAVIVLACPSCASPRVRLESGSDLQVLDVELGDPAPEVA